MASSAQLAARPSVPRPPDGTYGVPDPDAPDVLTLWQVSGGQVQPWPHGQRWAPRPPRTAQGLSPGERRTHRERWYASVYWPWKTAVVRAIVDDLDAAASRFEDAVPEDARPVVRPPYADRRAAERAEERALLRHRMRAAAAMHLAGLPYVNIGRAFNVASSTAWRWARQGLTIWEQDYRPEDLTAALAALPSLDAMREATPPPTPAPVPNEDDMALVAWAAAKLHMDPDEVSAVLFAAADPTRYDVLDAELLRLDTEAPDLPALAKRANSRTAVPAGANP